MKTYPNTGDYREEYPRIRRPREKAPRHSPRVEALSAGRRGECTRQPGGTNGAARRPEYPFAEAPVIGHMRDGRARAV